jgi:hypothetical protein
MSFSVVMLARIILTGEVGGHSDASMTGHLGSLQVSGGFQAHPVSFLGVYHRPSFHTFGGGVMDEMVFRREALRAQTKAMVEPQHVQYWRGYQDGLRRAQLGARFGSEAEHRYWLAGGGKDPRCAPSCARGAGYRDGLVALARRAEELAG